MAWLGDLPSSMWCENISFGISLFAISDYDALWVKSHQLPEDKLEETPGGPLVFQGGYHPRKKIHVIRVVFQDQTMYARTSFRVSKTC